ncbi:RNA polymerase sigma-70 factor, ECF subfamily [Flavobacterium resistens]|uniref:RNA polymerase sigma-70 factor n=1 Tax=Flavobacterium resistens TaxID=443612 RepID=A0A521AWD6_9FLAO|nr:RNA polymerase sigma-70 factor [Flavobacterium resistens]MRX68512.1 RNA polymerase sigma-70 factor [Flavobacterium resistens]SMO39153.1 RNA polymerase sigma-70 factor, ECF subfamily [Flavobacterium resistens]
MNNNASFEFNLFQSFKEGDETAFKYFYDKYFKRIQSFSFQFVNDIDEAENLAQEALLHLWQNRENIESINGIQAFLFTYAKSKCLNLIRHNKVKDKFKNDHLNYKQRELDIEVLNSIQFDTLELTELERIIQESISDLPAKTRAVFIKKRFENKKNAEIAEEMGVTLKAVEAHMTKALKILKTKLSDYLFLIFVLIYNN